MTPEEQIKGLQIALQLAQEMLADANRQLIDVRTQLIFEKQKAEEKEKQKEQKENV